MDSKYKIISFYKDISKYIKHGQNIPQRVQTAIIIALPTLALKVHNVGGMMTSGDLGQVPIA